MHTSKGWTPALHAANLGHFDALNLLLEHGANLEALNEGGTNCYDEIVRDDAVDLLEAIWPEAQKFQLNQKKQQAKHKSGSSSLIHVAAGAEGSKCLQFLIRKSDNPSALCQQLNNSIDKLTPLHCAALAGNFNNCKIILEILKQVKQKK